MQMVIDSISIHPSAAKEVEGSISLAFDLRIKATYEDDGSRSTATISGYATVEVNIGETKVKSIVESLIESALVEASGSGRGRYYMLGSKVYKESDDVIGYVRQTGIDKLKYQELILKLEKTQGHVTQNWFKRTTLTLRNLCNIIIVQGGWQ